MIKGLIFNNGVHAIAKVSDPVNGLMKVEDLLIINMRDSGKTDIEGKPVHAVTFEDVTDFAKINTIMRGTVETSAGIDGEIPVSSIMIFFPVEPRIEKGYLNRTSRIAV
jgi:hypothetical protein